jgi:hypothetical protein
MHNVSRDSIDVTVTYHAVVHPKLTPKASYDGTTTLRIFLNYSKVKPNLISKLIYKLD